MTILIIDFSIFKLTTILNFILVSHNFYLFYCVSA